MRSGSRVWANVVSAGLNLRIQAVLVLVPERRVADQQNVEDNTASPDVDGLAIGLLVQHLRRKVSRGAGETVPTALIARHFDREPEVGEFHDGSLGLAGEQQVLGFQVAVHDVQLVAVVYALEDLLHAVAGVGFAVELASYDVFEELAAGNSAGLGEGDGRSRKLGGLGVWVWVWV